MCGETSTGKREDDVEDDVEDDRVDVLLSCSRADPDFG
jgi:hypothetical protein